MKNSTVFHKEISVSGFVFTRMLKRFDVRNLLNLTHTDSYGLFKSHYSKSFYLWDKQKDELHEFDTSEQMVGIAGLYHVVGVYESVFKEMGDSSSDSFVFAESTMLKNKP